MNNKSFAKICINLDDQRLRDGVKSYSGIVKTLSTIFKERKINSRVKYVTKNITVVVVKFSFT